MLLVLLTLTVYWYIWVISLINNWNNRFIPTCIMKGGEGGLMVFSMDYLKRFYEGRLEIQKVLFFSRSCAMYR